jgi:hypothetical protein
VGSSVLLVLCFDQILGAAQISAQRDCLLKEFWRVQKKADLRV